MKTYTGEAVQYAYNQWIPIIVRTDGEAWKASDSIFKTHSLAVAYATQEAKNIEWVKENIPY